VGLVTDAQEPLHLLSVGDYHRMIDAGILGEEDRVELLEGAIIEMTPEGPAHSTVIARLNRFIARALDDPSLLLRVQSPLTFEPRSEPEPDLVVVDAAASTMRAHPTGGHLVIEVAKTSLRKDRERKARIYATAGVSEYWVFDLVNWCVHVHGDPRDGAYTAIHSVQPPDQLQASALELPTVPLAEILADD
jgi:Uma2 family endonuclease